MKYLLMLGLLITIGCSKHRHSGNLNTVSSAGFSGMFIQNEYPCPVWWCRKHYYQWDRDLDAEKYVREKRLEKIMEEITK